MSEYHPPFVADDAVRLAALADCDILDTPAEQGFDDISLLASHVCAAPVALVSLVDRDRQWFKASIGFSPRETDLDSSVCKFVLAEPDVLVIPDLRLNPCTNVNPLVTGDPRIRFYAGAPIRTPEGVTIGSLCVIDIEPRPAGLTEGQREALRALARHLTSLLDLRRNATRSRTVETALLASKSLARQNAERVQLALAAGAIIGTWFWDPVTDRFTVDDGFASNFGIDPDVRRNGVTLAHILAAVHPEDAAGLAAAIGEATARGGPYAHQYRTRRADGRYYWLEANGRVDKAPDGTPLSFPGVLIDIEERRAVEAERVRVTEELRSLNETLEQRVAERTGELMRAQEALRQSQKMEAVGQLTGGLAHDFNNLLAGISGSLELMQSRVQQGRYNDFERYMAAAQGAARRAAALTHRLLAFSRRQTLDPKPTDVNRLINGMQEMIQRTVGPAIHVEVVGAASAWPALVDPHQLENALLNLCINARDAMPDGGAITIETANKWLDERAARQQDMANGQYLTMSVTDTGVGMSPEVIARVFEPFFTTKPIGAGTGLGLSMIYGFAQQSGGQVRIYSEVGEGTTVSVYLPRCSGTVAEDDIAATLDALSRFDRGATVLVVDDEPTVRMLITDILEDLGCTAIEAGDSLAGLKILQSDVRIDLLVTDVGLPGGMNGRQMADAARGKRPDLKVLFITGYAENAALGNGQLAPGMAVMTKPFPMDAMAARIRSLIEADKETRRQRLSGDVGQTS